MCRLGLAETGDIVVLAFHRHQRDAVILDGSTGLPRCFICALGSAA